MTRNGDFVATVRRGTLVLALLGVTAFAACAHNESAAGGPLYGQFCAKCHGDAGQGTDQGPPVVGPTALPLDPRPTAKARKSQFHTAKDIADFVLPNMPPKGPKPTVEQYLDILAFDLKANGVDLTGKPALTPDMLSSIVIHP